MEKVFYYASVIDTLRVIAGVFLVLGIIAFVWFLIYTIDEYINYGTDDNHDFTFYRKATILSFIIVAVASLAIIFTPSRETYLLMQGSKAAEQIYNSNETLQELPKNTINFLNEYVKTLTEELKEVQEEE